jgi:hypothetical protein
MAPSRIEPATFQFVAQCFNQLRHSVPRGQLAHSFFFFLNMEAMCNSETVTVTFLRLCNYVFPPACGYHDNCLQHVEQIRLGFRF